MFRPSHIIACMDIEKGKKREGDSLVPRLEEPGNEAKQEREEKESCALMISLCSVKKWLH